MANDLGSPDPTADIPVLSGLDPIIETPRLRLRPFTLEDVEAIWPYVSDPTFPVMMSWEAHADREATRQWIIRTIDGWAKGTTATWAMTIDGTACGSIGLHGVQYRKASWRVDRADLGYWLGPPRWNHGLTTEAAAAVVRYGFERMRLHKITVSCLGENDASRRVIEKLDFRPVGRARDDVFRNGRWWDHLRYELTRGEA
jgi:ribosomal-protein-alanine N-acetyltransferase